MNTKYLISLFAFIILAQRSAVACPDISGYPDLNCDGNISIAVLGDSLVYGVGDTKNQNKGGYVLRAQAKLPALNFINLGEPGLNTVELLLSLKQAFNGKGEKQLLSGLTEADVVVLDLGRNDRWFFGTPEKTYRNLKKIRSTIGTGVLDFVGFTPLVVTSVLMLPNRGSQGPWVLALNKIIAAHHSGANPADLRFDNVSKRLLGSDQIHPTSLGYNSMSAVFIGYVRTKMKKYMNKLLDSLPTPTPTVAPTAVPTVTPTEAPTATPTATPTVTATSTPS